MYVNVQICLHGCVRLLEQSLGSMLSLTEHQGPLEAAETGKAIDYSQTTISKNSTS